jgi:hypothetical protein
MTPEQQQAIKKHTDAIAAILYADCDPESLKTLEDIEIKVKEQILSHVSPQIGFAWCNARRRRWRSLSVGDTKRG